MGWFLGICVGLYRLLMLFAKRVINEISSKILSIHKNVIIVCSGKLVSVVAISKLLHSNWPILTCVLETWYIRVYIATEQ